MTEAIAAQSPFDGERPDLLIIAGEHSGDEHAAAAVRALKRRRPEMKIAAFAGTASEQAGAVLVRDLTEAAVVGLVEVLKHYSLIKELFGECVGWIERHRPRAVCFVDYPGFNLRLAQTLFSRGLAARAGGPVRLLYYISPQIWAWKGKRRFTMAKLLDGLAVIFPFEVESYADTDLEVEFVGHPFLAADHQLPLTHEKGAPILLLPGSRRIAVTRIFPVLLNAFRAYRSGKTDAAAVVVYPDDGIRAILEAELARHPDLAGAVTLRHRRSSGPAGAVLTSSGTMSLSCALAGVPGVIAYRANWMTYLVGRAILKVPYLGICNLLLKRPMYPEYIQGAAAPDVLAAELRECAESEERLARTAKDAAELRRILSAPSSRTIDRWLEEKSGGD